MQANLRLERGVAADVHQYCRPDDRDALARCVLVVERVGVAGGGHVARGAGPGVGAGPGRRAGAAAAGGVRAGTSCDMPTTSVANAFHDKDASSEGISIVRATVLVDIGGDSSLSVSYTHL